MLTMREHGVEDYAALSHMDTTDVGELRDDDRACLEELGGYLVSTDAWQRFGIWLLHRHFKPEPGEVFVEFATQTPRKTETLPVMRSEFAEEGLSATAIRFGATGDGMEIVGMEFAQPGDFGDVDPLTDDDEDILTGICERLAANGKVDRFGVRLIRNPLGLSDSEMLHETCDSSIRTLHCSVGERNAMLGARNVIQTAWKWRVGDGAVVMQDCTAGCVRVGEGHDLAHTASGTDDFDNPTEGGPNQPF